MPLPHGTPPAQVITLQKTLLDHPTATPLLCAQQLELISLGVSYRDAKPLTSIDIPIFFLAFVDGKAVGCGGLRRVEARGEGEGDGEGEVEGNGGWDGKAEVKRMYVLPEYRGVLASTATATATSTSTSTSTVGDGERKKTSIARLLLDRLEEEARAWGCGRLVLATAACLVGANRFYARCGFVECEVFGGYGVEDESLYYEKRLEECGDE